MLRRSQLLRCAVLLAGACMTVAPVGADEYRVLLDDALNARTLTIDGLNADEVFGRTAEGDAARVSVPTASCLALLPEPGLARPRRIPGGGLLVLTDGQRFPGRIDDGAAPEDMLAWRHAWLGRMELEIDRVAALDLTGDGDTPRAGSADLVILRNGDRWEGFITQVGDPVEIAIGSGADERVNQIPLARIARIALVTESTKPSGRRLWFRDGTVLDSKRLLVGDDGYVRMTVPDAGADAELNQVRFQDVRAVLFRPTGLAPLASLTPSRVASSVPRFVVPAPKVIDDQAPLGLSAVEMSGPIVAIYGLPPGAKRFAASVRLPATARNWGDCVLVVRVDGEEGFRQRVNAEAPRHEINLDVDGHAELTFEILAGKHGPIQDRLVFDRAGFLVGP